MKITVKSLCKAFAIAALAVLTAVTVFACGGDKQKLSAPTELNVGTDDILRWTAVENATSYTVDIDGETYSAEQNSLDIFEITNQVKTYTIKVRADSNGSYDASPWSSGLEYIIPDTFYRGLTFSMENNRASFNVTNKSFLSGKIIIPAETPNGILEFIGRNTFENCDKITGILLPSTIRSLHNEAFMNCSRMERINLPSSLNSIDRLAFKDCAKLKSVHIPAGITIWDSSWFEGCSGVENISIDPNNEVFKSESGCVITKEDNSVEHAFKYSEIPNGVTKINKYAFLKLNGLTKVVIPDSVETIEDMAFRSCDDLTDISIGANVKNISENAFYKIGVAPILRVSEDNTAYSVVDGCLMEKATGLLILVGNKDKIPSVTKIIGASAAYSVPWTAVNIPSSVNTIQAGAFKSTSINTVTLSKSSCKINAEAFMGVTAYVPFDNWQDGWQKMFQMIGYGGIGAAFHHSSVVYGCETREDGGVPWVYSIKNNIEGVSPYDGGTDRIQDLCDNPRIPHRDGYVFKGWTSVEGGTTAEYAPYTLDNGEVAALSAAQRADIPQDATLYAVWIKE